jgi:hypothetical protein
MFPFVIEDALPKHNGEFQGVWNELNPKLRPWYLNNYSSRDEQGNVDGSVSWSKVDFNTLPFFKAASTVRLKIEKKLRKRLTLVKFHANGQTMSQVSKFHPDYQIPDTFYTAILFARPDWNLQWSGQFTVYDEERYHLFPYIPNQAVVIKSEWEHYGEHPNNYTKEMRVTVAFMYCLTDQVNELAKELNLRVVHMKTNKEEHLRGYQS